MRRAGATRFCIRTHMHTHARTHASTRTRPCAGRAPNVQNLGLEGAGVALGPKGQVVVDEYCRTSVPSIWAVGDVIDRIQVRAHAWN